MGPSIFSVSARRGFNILRIMLHCVCRRLANCFPVKFQLPAHQKSAGCTKTDNKLMRLLRGALLQQRRSLYLWKLAQAARRRASSSRLNWLSKVMMAPEALKPSPRELRWTAWPSTVTDRNGHQPLSCTKSFHRWEPASPHRVTSLATSASWPQVPQDLWLPTRSCQQIAPLKS